ncbi:MAG: TRAFs-binding domain-containing protein [Ginsengibacter sp.]
MYEPSCFILMPFGKKKGPEGIEFDFNYISENLIKPAITAAGLTPIRADAEKASGIIHKAMYERLVLCDYAIADLSSVNANVYYELGMRHTVKPYTTVCIMSNKTMPAFDLNLNRTYPYKIDDNGLLINIDADIKAITEMLLEAKKHKTTDSPVHQLVDGISFQKSLAHEKTDVFRDMVAYEKEIKEKLSDIRNYPVKEQRITLLNDYADTLVPIENQETGVLVDVMLSYRALSCWKEMIDWIHKLPEYVFNTQMVQEQYGFALNRNKQSYKAIEVLESLIKVNGPNPETNGILGRVFKDLSDDNTISRIKQESFVRKSIQSYLDGYEADIRDAYPGINAVTLMALINDSRYQSYISAVKLAVVIKMKTRQPDYWDYATLLELTVLEENEKEAKEQLFKALSEKTEPWMPETTINNLKKIKVAFQSQEKDVKFIEEIIGGLKE